MPVPKQPVTRPFWAMEPCNLCAICSAPHPGVTAEPASQMLGDILDQPRTSTPPWPFHFAPVPRRHRRRGGAEPATECATPAACFQRPLAERAPPSRNLCLVQQRSPVFSCNDRHWFRSPRFLGTADLSDKMPKRTRGTGGRLRPDPGRPSLEPLSLILPDRTTRRSRKSLPCLQSCRCNRIPASHVLTHPARLRTPPA